MIKEAIEKILSLADVKVIDHFVKRRSYVHYQPNLPGA